MLTDGRCRNRYDAAWKICGISLPDKPLTKENVGDERNRRSSDGQT